MRRAGFLGSCVILAGVVALLIPAWTGSQEDERPNIVIVFTDDQGYGDLGCYGSEEIRTPRLDRLAAEGTRFTDFYAQVTCGPSRSALLTGRYPVRSGGWSMPAAEITLAELLQEAGYATCCIGKWDVSNRAAVPERMPRAKGFDYYWGPLGANDAAQVKLHENDEPAGIIEDMASLTRLYTDKGIEWLEANSDRPFFLYLSHTMVHSIIDASPEFKAGTEAGLYAAAVEELDHHTGRLLDAIDELGVRERTIVIFTSDNGPWNNMQKRLRERHDGAIAWGSSGPLREGKGSTYEGGLRVPCIVRWPGRVPAGRVNDAVFSTLDFMPTFATLAGYQPPTDRIVDGVDQTELLLGRSTVGAREDFFYFCRNEMQAVRSGRWKLVLPDLKEFYNYVDERGSGKVELYDLRADVGETENLAEREPEVVERLMGLVEAFQYPEQIIEHSIKLPKD